MSKIQIGQQAVSRILQIRQFYAKSSNLKAKKQYTQQFRTCLLSLVKFINQSDSKYAQQINKKIPNLQAQLKKMRSQVKELQEGQIRKTQKVDKSNIDSLESPQKLKLGQTKNQLEQGIMAAIVREKPQILWDDVAGLEQAKSTLQQAIILPIKHPQIFVGQRTPWKGILLYGPPGTGKTFLAKACATEMKNGTFFSVSSSDLMSKYVGQSQKTLKALFKVAKIQKPSIIFIDEIDSIAGQRKQDQNQGSRRVKTQLLIQMQGLGNQCKQILVLGATNLPWAIDSAVRRRFEKRVYIPLPDTKGRLAMLKKVIEKNHIQITKQQMFQLANLTEGYSGSDISNMINDALMVPVRKLDKTRLWAEFSHNGTIKYIAQDDKTKRDPSKKYFQGTMYQLKDKGSIHLITTFDDFITALKSSKPSVCPGDLDRYAEFTKKFGMDG